MAQTAGLFPKLVERHANGGPVQPAARPVAPGQPGISPEFPENLDGDFLRARRVAYHPDNDAGNAFVMNVEKDFEIESVVGCAGFDRLAWRVHVMLTTPGRVL
jgi:hypothetical protein